MLRTSNSFLLMILDVFGFAVQCNANEDCDTFGADLMCDANVCTAIPCDPECGDHGYCAAIDRVAYCECNEGYHYDTDPVNGGCGEIIFKYPLLRGTLGANPLMGYENV